MPVIEMYSPLAVPPRGMLEALAQRIQTVLGLPDDRVWLWWNAVEKECFFRQDWNTEPEHCGPIVKIRCKTDYTPGQVQAVMMTLAHTLSERLNIPVDTIYIVVDPVEKGRLFIRGNLWT